MDRYFSTAVLPCFLVTVIFCAMMIVWPTQGVSNERPVGSLKVEREVMIIEIEGAISSGAATNLARGIKEAEDRNQDTGGRSAGPLGRNIDHNGDR